MFGPLGFPELIFILVLALLVFGPKRLPEIGRTIGRGMAEFRKASNDLKRSINTELALDEPPQPPILRQPRLETPPMTTPRTAAPLSMADRLEEDDFDEPLETLEPDDTPPVETAETAEAIANEPLEPR